MYVKWFGATVYIKDNTVQFLSSHTGGAGGVSSEAGRGEEQQAENQLSPGGGTSIPSYSV